MGRETCEETRDQVHAVRRLTQRVFRCDLVQADVCKKKKDEGFLRRKWVRASELSRLQFRGGTWGNKRQLLQNCLTDPERHGCGVAPSYNKTNRGGKRLDSSRGKDPRTPPYLEMCQGDCDEDFECAGGLNCFQRDGHEPIPGCSGRGIRGFDYCYSGPSFGPQEHRRRQAGGQYGEPTKEEMSLMNNLLRLIRNHQHRKGGKRVPSSNNTTRGGKRLDSSRGKDPRTPPYLEMCQGD